MEVRLRNKRSELCIDADVLEEPIWQLERERPIRKYEKNEGFGSRHELFGAVGCGRFELLGKRSYLKTVHKGDMSFPFVALSSSQALTPSTSPPPHSSWPSFFHSAR